VGRETLANGTKHPLPLWLFEVRERATGNSDPRVRDFVYRPVAAQAQRLPRWQARPEAVAEETCRAWMGAR